MDRLRTLRLLLIVTYRPEFDPPWIGRPYVTTLNLNRLGEREIAAMIEMVTRNKSLPEDIKQEIVDRTDGIPLFVEEMTKAVLEAQHEGAAGSTVTTIPSPSIGVPASLHASLMARLDRLGDAKEVAQIGAVLGREFSHGLLAAVARKSETALKSALDRLIAAGLLFRQGVPPHASYLFKHALVQDAAYSTLLREPRRALHALIAETLQINFAEFAERQPEVVARHCSEAALIEKAAFFWGKAGKRSLARSALVEAAAQLTRALDQIATLPATPELRREQIELQVAVITPLMYVKGYVAPETKAAMEHARSLIEEAERLGEPPKDRLLLFSVLYGFWTASHVAFNGDNMCELATQFLALAERQTSSVPRMVGHRLMGMSLVQTGDICRGRAHFDQAITLYDPIEHRPMGTRFGVDTRVSILSNRSWALWMLGYPAMALADAERALQEARDVGQAANIMYLVHLAFPLTCCGEYAAPNKLLEEIIGLTDEKNALYFKALAVMFQGCLFAATGKALDAIRLMVPAIASVQKTGSTLWVPFYLSSLASAYAKASRFSDATRSVEEAIAMLQTTGERWCEAEISRIAGEIALQSPERDTAKAEGHFQRALAVARQQQAKSWELRAAMSLARLWRSQGKVKQARDLLAPVYAWFTEGFDTRDLKEAKALLGELT
jgi:predicted ATPase